MTGRFGAAAFLVALAASTAAVVAVTSGSATQRAANAVSSEPTATAVLQRPLRYERHDLFIETNATDGDAGLQVSLDAEDWRWLKLRDPRGKLILDLQAKGRLRGYGLTELFFEASEPSFDEVPFRVFKKRFPEGKYSFRGQTVEGRRLVGSDRLSHLVPAAPKVTFPTAGARVDPNGFAVTWEPVTTPAGVKIVSYQVIVSQGERDLSMYLPADATSASIPGEFLQPGTETEAEVLARERSGNQTITELRPFMTR
jgi:hypothetical protein